MSSATEATAGIRGLPDPSAAVIADARRRHRRRQAFTLAACGVVVAAYFVGGHPGLGTSGQAASRSVTPMRASTCLLAEHALVATAGTGPTWRSAPAIHVSFALIPGRRLDGATLYFQRSPSAAKAVLKTLVARFRWKAPYVGSYFTIAHNTIVFWDAPHTSTASRAAVLGCL